jgi:hypothetical protein
MSISREEHSADNSVWKIMQSFARTSQGSKQLSMIIVRMEHSAESSVTRPLKSCV